MKTLAKILGATVAAVVLLLILAAIIVPLVVDPNDHKDPLVALVKEHTGRNLEIGGHIAVNVFPWLGLSVADVRLTNGAGYQNAYMAELSQVSVRVAWWPLLRQRLQLDKVTLHGLVINLERTADGRGNWEEPAGPWTRASTPPADGSSPLAALGVGGLDIRDATLTWYDAVDGQAYTVVGLNIATGALQEGSPVAVKTAFQLMGKPLGVQGRVSATGRLSLHPTLKLVRMEDLIVDADLVGERLPGGRARLEAGGDLTLKTGERRVTVPNLTIRASGINLENFKAEATVTAQLDGDLARRRYRLGGVRTVANLDGTSGEGERVVLELITELDADLSRQRLMANSVSLNVSELSLADLDGRLALNGVLSGDLAKGTLALTDIRWSGTLSGAPLAEAGLTFESTVSASADLPRRLYQARGLRVQATLAGARVPGGQQPLELAGDLDYEGDKGALVASDITFQVAGVVGSGELVATRLTGRPLASGSVRIDRLNPRDLLARLDRELPESADEPALESARLSTNFRLDDDAVHFTALDIQVDDARVQGQVAINDVTLPAARFDLRGNRLNVDRYRALLAGGDAADQVSAPPSGAAVGALAIPVKRLREMQLEGRVRVTELIAGGAKLSGVDASLSATDGVLRLSPVKATLYGGTLDAQLELDARGDSPSLEFEEKLEGVRADKLLADLGLDTGDFRLRGASDWSLRGSLTGGTAGRQYHVHGLEIRARLADETFADGVLAAGLDGDLDMDLQRDTLRAEALRVSVDEAQAVGDLVITQLGSDSRLAGTVKAGPFDPRRLLRQVLQKPVKTTDPKALASASLSASLLASPSAVSVDALSVSVDKTKVTGSLSVENFAAPELRFDIAVDELDLDRYLPPAGNETGVASMAPGATVALLPVNTVRDLDVQGEVHIAKLKVRNVTLQDIHLSARGKDGELRVNPVDTGLYDGSLGGDVYVDARGGQLRGLLGR
jgi:uncharacterized protein involved in outer membrane biogenesis